MALAGIMRTVDLVDTRHTAHDHDLLVGDPDTLTHRHRLLLVFHSGIGGCGCTLGLWAE